MYVCVFGGLVPAARNGLKKALRSKEIEREGRRK